MPPHLPPTNEITARIGATKQDKMKGKNEKKVKSRNKDESIEPIGMSFEEALRIAVRVPKSEIDKAMKERSKKKPRGKQSPKT